MDGFSGGSRLTAGDGTQSSLESLWRGAQTVGHPVGLRKDLKMDVLARGKVVRLQAGRMVRMRTRLGHEVVGNPGARLRGFGGPLALGELTAGDRVAAARYVPASGGNDAEMSKSEVEFLAFALSDGALTMRRAFVFYNEDPETVEAFRESAEGMGGLRVRKVEGRQAYGVSRSEQAAARGDRNGAIALLDALGVYGVPSKERRLPAEVFRLAEATLALFIGRLWSGDGSCYIGAASGGGNALSFWSRSIGLCQDVQRLLLRFRIIARLGHHGAGGESMWSVDVWEAEKIRLFVDSFGEHLIGPMSQRCEQLVATLSNYSRPKYDVVPAEVVDMVESARLNAGVSKMYVEKASGIALRKRGNFSRRRILEAAAALGSQELYEVGSSDVVWDKVEEVQRIAPAESFVVVDATQGSPTRRERKEAHVRGGLLINNLVGA